MNISSVVKNNKCMSCGGCALACSKNAISLNYDIQEGIYKPVIQEDLCVKCGKCLQICPTKDELSDTLVGNYKNIYLAYSSNEFVRKMATSGGVINSLLRFLLKENIVDYVLLVRHDENSPIESSAQLISFKDINELITNAREYTSRYIIVPILEKLNHTKLSHKRLAVVGTPCQIRAAKKCLKHSTCENFFIGITCSGGMRYTATKEYKRVKNRNNAKMYYRGNGWPGTNNLISVDENIEFNHSGSLFERMFSSQVFKNPGCRGCHDHFAEEADISFCDFWNAEEIKEEKLGNSCVIIRSNKAEKIFENMKKFDYIFTKRELTEEEVILTQKQIINVKKGFIKSKKKYSNYNRLMDFIYKFKLYKFFNYKIYDKLSSYFYKMSLNINDK